MSSNKEFFTQLQALLRQAPENISFFFIADSNSAKFNFIKGSGLDLVSSISTFLAKNTEMKKIIKASLEVSEQDFVKEFVKILK